jgi:thioredoxin-related protein
VKFLAILFSVMMLSLPVKAYELLMFSVNWCSYCVAFHEQVVPTYNDTEYAETLPLTIIDAEDIPEWFTVAYEKGDIEKIKGTPTFIIWNEETQVEVDRIVGYNGKEWFYERIDYWIEHYEEYYGQ